MNDGESTMSREQRDAIIRAIRAIEIQLKEMDSKPRWQSFYVITTNLAVIQTNVLNLPRVSPN